MAPKQYKPAKFGEGLQPGTVEWEHRKRRRHAAMERRLEKEALLVKREEKPRDEWPMNSRMFWPIRAVRGFFRLFR